MITDGVIVPFPRGPFTREDLLILAVGVAVTLALGCLVVNAVIAAWPRIRKAIFG